MFSPSSFVPAAAAKAVVWIALFALLLCTPTARAQCVPTPIIRMGGATTHVSYVSATVAADSRGQILERIDLTNPFSPTVTSSLDMGETIADLHSVGGVTFAAYGRTIAAFDASVSPPTPLIATTLPGSGFTRITQLIGAGDRFNPLLVVKADHTYIYTIGAGGSLTLRSTFDPLGTLGVVGNFLIGSYVSFVGSTQFFIVNDISNPAAPVQRGTWQAVGSYGFEHSITGDNARVYVAVGSILHTFDIANPDAPTRLNTLNVGNEVTDLALAGSLFACTKASFGSSTGAGFKVLSLANSSAPAVIGTYATASPAVDVAIGSSRAHLACAEGGLHVVNIATPAAPAFMGRILPAPGRADHVTISGNTAFVSSGTVGVWIIDITNPAAPLVRSLAPTLDARSTLVVGTKMYVADGFNGMRIFDVSNTAAPVLRSTFNPPGSFETYKVGVTGNTAVMCNVQGGGSAEIVDVTNDAAPVLRSTISNGDYFFDVAFNGTRAYFANSRWGVSVYDLGNPAAPVLRYLGPQISSQTRAIEAAGTAVYAITGGAFQIIDMSTPATPLLIGQTNVGSTDDFRVFGATAYIPQANGTRILDLSQPARPVVITTLDSPDYAESLAVHSSSRMVEGNGLGGLTIYNPLTMWAPAFLDGLTTRRVCANATVDLSTAISASPFPTGFHWRKQSAPQLANGVTATGSILSGVNSFGLRIDNASAFDNGRYIYEVTNTCGTSSSPGIDLIVCMADHNCSGTVSVQDIFDFLADYFAGRIAADINRSGVVSVQDIFDFLAAYFAGC